eukprot:scaffold12726_cov33-Attheya_sp.AAC.1
MGMGDGAKMRFQIPSRIRQDDVTRQCCDATMSSINRTCRIPDQAATRVTYIDKQVLHLPRLPQLPTTAYSSIDCRGSYHCHRVDTFC